MSWVSLTERKPEYDQRVLLGANSLSPIMAVCKLDKGWEDPWVKWTVLPFTPTHWLPIPEIPQPDPFEEWWEKLELFDRSEWLRVIPVGKTKPCIEKAVGAFIFQAGQKAERKK